METKQNKTKQNKIKSKPLTGCFWEISVLECLFEVPAHQCTQHEEEVQGIRDLCAVAGPQPCWHHKDVMG